MGSRSPYDLRPVIVVLSALCIAVPSVSWAKTKTCDATNLGQTCSRDGKEGTCGKGECCRLDYDKRKPDLPPPQVCEPCILCIVPHVPPVLEKLTPTFPDVANAPTPEPTDVTPAPPTPVEPDAGPQPAPDKDATQASPEDNPALPAADASSGHKGEVVAPKPPSESDSVKAGETKTEDKGAEVQPTVTPSPAKPPTTEVRSGPVGGAKGRGGPIAQGADEEPVTGDDVLWSVGLLLALALLFVLVRWRRVASNEPDEGSDEGTP
jgi:hypothetical protein